MGLSGEGVGPTTLTPMRTPTESNPTETCETIKLGIDAHAKWYYVGRQVDGATPQPVQKMTFEGLLHFVARQLRLAGIYIRLIDPMEEFSFPPTRVRLTFWTGMARVQEPL